jgi:hypothetical protein
MIGRAEELDEMITVLAGGNSHTVPAPLEALKK